jgi:hypothetical protein
MVDESEPVNILSPDVLTFYGTRNHGSDLGIRKLR